MAGKIAGNPNRNRHREALFFSPHCLKTEGDDWPLFEKEQR